MPAPTGHAVFETGLGFIGIAWSNVGLVRLCLPEQHQSAVEKRLSSHGARVDTTNASTDVSRWVAELIRAITAYAAGQQTDFRPVAVDLDGVDNFRLAVYAAARNLHFGETVTYGELAARAGHAGLARETGAALGTNPVPMIIPCHRVVAAGNRIGGFSAPGGAATKTRMLNLEGVRLGPPPTAQRSFGF